MTRSPQDLPSRNQIVDSHLNGLNATAPNMYYSYDSALTNPASPFIQRQYTHFDSSTQVTDHTFFGRGPATAHQYSVYEFQRHQRPQTPVAYHVLAPSVDHSSPLQQYGVYVPEGLSAPIGGQLSPEMSTVALRPQPPECQFRRLRDRQKQLTSRSRKKSDREIKKRQGCPRTDGKLTACLFCRTRKVACKPMPGNVACKQCDRRSLLCESIQSLRGTKGGSRKVLKAARNVTDELRLQACMSYVPLCSSIEGLSLM